jgi:hypothetical protein
MATVVQYVQEMEINGKARVSVCFNSQSFDVRGSVLLVFFCFCMLYLLFFQPFGLLVLPLPCFMYFAS